MTYADLEAAPAVLLVSFEPEEESPIVYLRLRKAAPHQVGGLLDHAVRHPRAAQNMGGSAASQAAPGGEAEVPATR